MADLQEIMPAWVIVQTKMSSEEVVERALRAAGYRSYLPRYRKLVMSHGRERRSATAMRPLFPRLVFAQDWRGWPGNSITGAVGLMHVRSGLARLSDEDVALIMGRERVGDFDDARHANGNGGYVRDDIVPGDQVAIDMMDRRVMGVLVELSLNGKAIVSAMLFDRAVRAEVDAETLHRVCV